jgi:hypothetical protein
MPRPRARFEMDPREVENFVRPMPPRQELVYRLAARGLCQRCRGDRAFQHRTDELMVQFKDDLAGVLQDAAALEAKLIESVSQR